jgi:glycosyltransferase involved in cell wall biosynthesis
MASGLPVIAADAGGTKDLVVPGLTGTVFEPHQPDALVQKICTAVIHPDLCKIMGMEGRKQALGRSWEQIFDGLIRDYEEVIERRCTNHQLGINGIFSA